VRRAHGRGSPGRARLRPSESILGPGGVPDPREVPRAEADGTKNYSSGMLLRLGFSIAVQVHPEAFLIDQVFAVAISTSS
jgi:hypothetical protein